MSVKKDVQAWLNVSLEDPIVKILAKNSNLTKIQLETLLIDVLAENLAAKKLNYEEKAKIRQVKAEISRGSFNRTLRQAKINAIQAVYTVILLGYFGIFEDTRLTPFLEVANKLKTYTEAYRDMLSTSKSAAEQTRIIEMLREELENTLSQLAQPWSSRS